MKSLISSTWRYSLITGIIDAVVATNSLVVEGDVERLILETWPAFTAELLFTFALAYVILNVATSETTDGNGFLALQSL